MEQSEAGGSLQEGFREEDLDHGQVFSWLWGVSNWPSKTCEGVRGMLGEGKKSIRCQSLDLTRIYKRGLYDR